MGNYCHILLAITDYLYQNLKSTPLEKDMVHYSKARRRQWHRLNRDDHPCETDQKYQVVRCIERYIQGKTTCNSPWDVFPHPKV